MSLPVLSNESLSGYLVRQRACADFSFDGLQRLAVVGELLPEADNLVALALIELTLFSELGAQVFPLLDELGALGAQLVLERAHVRAIPDVAYRFNQDIQNVVHKSFLVVAGIYNFL